MRILLIAPFADPLETGEAWSNFQWVSGIAKRMPVTVLSCYKKRNNGGVKKYLPGVEVIEWKEPDFFDIYDRFNSIAKPGYFLFYLKARKWIRSEISKGRTWDIVHQISPLAVRYPSPVRGLHIPYIIGPLAGSIEIPKAFIRSASTMPWYYKLRKLDRLRLKIDPYLRESYKGSAAILCVAPYVKELFDGLDIKRFVVMNETGVLSLPEKRISLSENASEKKFRLLYVGRVIRTKGVRDFVRAVGIIKDITDIAVDIIGDGEDLAYCKQLAQQIGVEKIIKFHGRISRSDVNKHYASADLFVFPSFKEPSGNVVLESMSYGLPLIVWDGGGPGYTVKDSFGVKVTASSEDEYAENIAKAIRELYLNPKKLKLMGTAALQEVNGKHLWEKKISDMLNLYSQIVND